MNNMQNLVLKVLLVFIIVLSMGVLSWGYFNYRQAQNIVDPNRIISFTEEGKIVAKPDIAEISFSVITQKAEAAAVQAESNQKMQKIIDFVKEQGIAEEDIQTTNYNLNPQYDYHWCLVDAPTASSRRCSPKIIGYELTQTVAVKIRDFDTINTIVGGLSEAGANQISDISFTIDDPGAYKNQARIKALKAIEQRARVLSRETSLELGRIVGISESGALPISAVFARNQKVGADLEETAVPAPIAIGVQEISVTLTVSYEIK